MTKAIYFNCELRKFENITKHFQKFERRFYMFPNLRAEMARKNINVNELAKQIGMSNSTMADKVHGRTTFSLENAIAIKNALGVDMSLEELFHKEED